MLPGRGQQPAGGVLLALLAGCLGPYAYTQQFPVYALASLDGGASLDPVFVALVG